MAVCSTLLTTRTNRAAVESVNFKRTSCRNQTGTSQSLHSSWFGCKDVLKPIYLCVLVSAIHQLLHICVLVHISEALCLCCGSHHCGLCQLWNTTFSVIWVVTGTQRETWNGVSTENSLYSVLFSLPASVALSLNHQQKIKVIIVMNSLTGLRNSGWIYEHLYNNSTVIWGNLQSSLELMIMRIF